MIHNKTYKIGDFGLAKKESTVGTMYLLFDLGRKLM